LPFPRPQPVLVLVNDSCHIEGRLEPLLTVDRIKLVIKTVGSISISGKTLVFFQNCARVISAYRHTDTDTA